MKKALLLAGLSVLTLQSLFAQNDISSDATSSQSGEFKIVTVIESIIPMGLGRSRIIDSKTQIDAEAFSTDRTEGNKSNQKGIKRKDIKIDELEETKLLNFYSATGINFQNIASNDAVIASKINNMMADGWKLTYVTSGVESDGGAEDGQGIFITRMFFYRD